MVRPWGLVVHGGTSIGSMEVKLKDYLDGATVLFDDGGSPYGRDKRGLQGTFDLREKGGLWYVIAK